MRKETIVPIFILIALATAWGQTLDIIIRDFPEKYPGFQEFDYNKSNDKKQCNTKVNDQDADKPTKGMVQKELDYSQCPAEQQKGTLAEKSMKGRYCARPLPAKPAPSKMCYGENLESWYTDGGKAKTFKTTMPLKQTGRFYEINDNAYFPLDDYPDSETYGKFYADPYQGEGGWHNYGFTVAGSAEFRYVEGNEDYFTFKGDDDMWVFIDGVLVIDLGGVHSEIKDSISINKLAKENAWKDSSMHVINFFYAERQSVASHLQLRFTLTDLSESQLGAPFIKNATTKIKDDRTTTTIWVSKKLDENSITQFIGSEQFPIIVRSGDPTKTEISGYKLSSIEFIGADGKEGYKYIITGNVCKTKNDCTLTLGTDDSLSFNVRTEKVISRGLQDKGGFTFKDDKWYIKSVAGWEATELGNPDNGRWAPNKTTMSLPEFKPIPGDVNPVKPPFSVKNWFTGDPREGACDYCDHPLPGTLPGGGQFPLINKIFDPKTGQMVSVPKTNSTVHGFGKVGTPIPPQRAGELILTAFPNASGTVNTIEGTKTYKEWMENEKLQKLFGLPPESYKDQLYGVADPKTEASDGGYQFVKNGFPEESSTVGNFQIAPTRCIADRTNEEKPRINCLNFSLLATQPFQLSVILYDQLGNFVTQYREVITEQEFRGVVQGPNYFEDVSNIVTNGNKCEAPTKENYGKPNVLTTNGLVKVNVNIYPFSSDGRRFGNGVYIAKIDRVDLPYEGCFNNNNQATFMTLPYMRYHAEQKFGWMRVSSGDKDDDVKGKVSK